MDEQRLTLPAYHRYDLVLSCRKEVLLTKGFLKNIVEARDCLQVNRQALHLAVPQTAWSPAHSLAVFSVAHHLWGVSLLPSQDISHCLSANYQQRGDPGSACPLTNNPFGRIYHLVD